MDSVIDNLDLYWDGFLTTLQLTLVSAAFALVLGTFLGACRVSPVPTLRGFGTVYVELLRNTPLTLVFFFFVFVAPQVDLKFPFFTSALVALSLYTAAFVCEAVRSGVNSVGVGQAEAARAIGLTFTQSMAQIVLPQAFRTVVPPLINIFIALTKNSSIAAGFFTTELVAVSIRLTNRFPSDTIVILLGIAVCYLAITVPAGILATRLERKVAFARCASSSSTPRGPGPGDASPSGRSSRAPSSPPSWCSPRSASTRAASSTATAGTSSPRTPRRGRH
jgi:glutamate transport system permease protein